MSENPQPTGRSNPRLRQTAADMIRSLAVVLGVVAVILIITMRPQPDPIRTIDPSLALAQARVSAEYPVLFPAGLTEDWRPTSARWEPAPQTGDVPVWHLGLITPQGDYVQVTQTASTAPRWVEEQIDGGRPDGEGPAGWQRYANATGDRALVTVVDGVTIVVSGTAPFDVLSDVADRLSPTAPAAD